MSCDDVRPLIDAYVDGELDAARVREIERHAGGCESCQDAIAEIDAAHRLVASASYHRAPAGLLARISQAIDREDSAAVSAGWGPGGDTVPASRSAGSDTTIPGLLRSLRLAWSSFGLAAAAALVLAVVLVGHRPEASLGVSGDPLVAQVVAAHIRSLQPGHLEDVISTDQHTVKPWFAGKVDFSPTVVDLAAKGFPLVGGRLDYIGGRSVAALIYRRNKHLINVFVWPASGVTPVARSLENGYGVYAWTGGGEAHYVVTDAAPAEINRLVAMLSQQ